MSGYTKSSLFSKLLRISADKRLPGQGGDRATNFVIDLGSNLQRCKRLSIQSVNFPNNFYNVFNNTFNGQHNNIGYFTYNSVPGSFTITPGFYNAAQLMSAITTAYNAAIAQSQITSFTQDPISQLVTLSFDSDSKTTTVRFDTDNSGTEEPRLLPCWASLDLHLRPIPLPQQQQPVSPRFLGLLKPTSYQAPSLLRTVSTKRDSSPMYWLAYPSLLPLDNSMCLIAMWMCSVKSCIHAQETWCVATSCW